MAKKLPSVLVYPLIIDRDCVEHEDAFEATDYGEGTIDCVLPLHPDDDQTHIVQYLDDKLRLVQPMLMVRAAGALNDIIIFPDRIHLSYHDGHDIQSMDEIQIHLALNTWKHPTVV